jgi:hypothetical protein
MEIRINNQNASVASTKFLFLVQNIVLNVLYAKQSGVKYQTPFGILS